MMWTDVLEDNMHRFIKSIIQYRANIGLLCLCTFGRVHYRMKWWACLRFSNTMKKNRKLCELPRAPGTVFSPSLSQKPGLTLLLPLRPHLHASASVFWLLSLRLWMSAWSIASKSPYVMEEVKVDHIFMESYKLRCDCWGWGTCN